MHKRPVIGLAIVTEEDYFHILEFISLKALNAAHNDIDITDTQKQLVNILQRVVNMGASDLHITRHCCKV
ncbi:pilus assembly protein, partial [Citrobacter werkmanii]|nr:pilus assembly protein [Citrobacter werkmanii]